MLLCWLLTLGEQRVAAAAQEQQAKPPHIFRDFFAASEVEPFWPGPVLRNLGLPLGDAPALIVTTPAAYTQPNYYTASSSSSSATMEEPNSAAEQDHELFLQAFESKIRQECC